MKEVEPDNKWTEEAGVEPSPDPFHPSNIDVVANITLLRIYDVLAAMLTSMDERAAERLMDLHAKGGLMAPAPAYDPRAVSDPGQVDDEE